MRRRAATIVELLVTVAVVAIVVGITIPVLRTVAMKRHDVKNLTSLRSTHQQFRQYANDHQDYFLNAGLPRRPGYPAAIDYGPGNGFEHISYLGQDTWWPMVLSTYTKEGFPTWHSTHWPPPERGPAHVHAGYTNTRYIAESGFIYSLACVTDPSLCRDSADASGGFDRYYQLVRWSTTAHPSSKGMLFDGVSPSRDDRTDWRNVVFVDGSAGLYDFFSPVASPEGARRRGRPVSWTPEGILGRDF